MAPIDFDTILWNIRKTYVIFRYKFFDFIDPVPKIHDEESVEEYIYRIEMRHALSYLDFFIGIITDYNVEEIDGLLLIEKDENKIKFLNVLKDFEKMKFKYKLLREQVIEYYKN